MSGIVIPVNNNFDRKLGIDIWGSYSFVNIWYGTVYNLFDLIKHRWHWACPIDTNYSIGFVETNQRLLIQSINVVKYLLYVCVLVLFKYL